MGNCGGMEKTTLRPHDRICYTDWVKREVSIPIQIISAVLFLPLLAIGWVIGRVKERGWLR